MSDSSTLTHAPADFSSPATELIRRRYSCRIYDPRPITAGCQASLSAFLASNVEGPLGSRGRFALVAATEEDRTALKGLGTYGFIKHAPGFIVGAVEQGRHALEDAGYLLERAILQATALGLGTCWLGGSFTKSRFARTIAVGRGEIMPAVVAVGYAADGSRSRDYIRRQAGSDSRLPAERLFFEGDFATPISTDAAGRYAPALEAVRWAPSASNRQPWRIVRTDSGWHFYLERTKGYGKGSFVFTVLRLADLQRVDLGIAACHFALAAVELDLQGSWVLDEPPIASGGRKYIATWRVTGAQR